MSDAIELVLDAKAGIGESPTWFAPHAALYWMDIRQPALHRYQPQTGEVRYWSLPAEIGAFALTEGGAAAIVALRNGVHRLNLTDGTLACLAPPPFNPATTRFNEGICDQQGGLWLGVMIDPPRPDARPGPLHRFTRSGGLQPRGAESDLHNGMGFSPDFGRFYLSHSNRGEVTHHAYDPASATLGPATLFATLPPDIGQPDGAAVDEEGCYWCAVHGGWALHRYRPDGALDRVVKLPVSQPTMCAFAGDNLSDMYITSAREGLNPLKLLREPRAGGLFRFRPGMRGVPRPCVVT